MDRRTKMDDFKRGIYLAARRELEERCEFLCVLLRGELKGLGTGMGTSDEELKKLFPEFFDLWDGSFWLTGVEMAGVGEHSSWWFVDEDGRLCRIALIDFLLTRGT